MHVRDFDFVLPPELIAQEPLASPGDARLLVLNRPTTALTHSTISSLPDLLTPGDLLVVNDTRVFPARLIGRRVPSGGVVECLLTRRLGPTEAEPEGSRERWEALVHPGQKLKPGSRIVFDGVPRLSGEVLERHGGYGRRIVGLWTDDGSPVEKAVDATGHVPLPPYIRRDDRPSDRMRYQTVFADRRGSVAAPTAGLHFSETLIDRLAARGVGIARITLHVGYGTFQPVRVDCVEDHRVEPEWFEVGEASAASIAGALDERRRVIAVGTTTTRTLESVARAHAGRIVAGSGWTDLFIYPGFRFQVVQGLLTNFHLPRSSLLMLVAAFAGRATVLDAYRVAVREGYRFYSYGDAMLIV